MLTVPVPKPFDFRLMVVSHGWHDLPPFAWRNPERLRAVIPLRGVLLEVEIAGEDGGSGATALHVEWDAHVLLARAQQDELHERIRWMFRLDEDFGPFHAQCRRRGLRWISEFGLGPFVRNASWFEEFTKILLTTNVNWAGTRTMATRLVEAYGEVGTGGTARAFPTAERVAGLSEKELRATGRVGYRAPFLLELAEGVASGRVDLAALAASREPTEMLRRELKRHKGFGDYAVNALLLSFGRYDELILDSWIRPMVARRHFTRPLVTDRSIRRLYAPWEEWKALACWFDCAHETWLWQAIPHARRSRRSLAEGSERRGSRRSMQEEVAP